MAYLPRQVVNSLTTHTYRSISALAVWYTLCGIVALVVALLAVFVVHLTTSSDPEAFNARILSFAVVGLPLLVAFIAVAWTRFGVVAIDSRRVQPPKRAPQPDPLVPYQTRISELETKVRNVTHAWLTTRQRYLNLLKKRRKEKIRNKIRDGAEVQAAEPQAAEPQEKRPTSSHLQRRRYRA